MLESPGNGWNVWKWLEMAGYGWKRLECQDMAGSGLKWLDIVRKGIIKGWQVFSLFESSLIVAPVVHEKKIKCNGK